MGDNVKAFSSATVEQLAKILGDAATGSCISIVFTELKLKDTSCESTKWRRINAVFQTELRITGSANSLLRFIQLLLAPVRFIDEAPRFVQVQSSLNAVLSMEGLKYTDAGEFIHVERVTTLSEATKRRDALMTKLGGRGIHSEVLRFCREELLDENYFHALFEATKGLAERIRKMTGLNDDGVALVEKAFSVKAPILSINTLATSTECSEQNGFAALLKGCFGILRNPLAHTPKCLWKGEDDVADYFSLLSLLHRKLDVACRPPLASKND